MAGLMAVKPTIVGALFVGLKLALAGLFLKVSVSFAFQRASSTTYPFKDLPSYDGASDDSWVPVEIPKDF